MILNKGFSCFTPERLELTESGGRKKKGPTGVMPDSGTGGGLDFGMGGLVKPFLLLPVELMDAILPLPSE